MFRKSLLLALMAVPAAIVMGQTAKPVNSTAKEVTLFLNGAQVTREGEVTLGSGAQEIRFRGLETGIDPKSIQVTAPPDVLIQNVQHVINYNDPNLKTPEIKKLEDSLLVVNDLLDGEKVKMTILEQEKALLMANQNMGGKEQFLPVSELEKAAEFYRSRLTDISRRQSESKLRTRDLELTRQRLSSTYGELNAARNQPSNEIVVNMSVTQSRSAKIKLRYLVANCGWIPSYDLRAFDAKDKIQLDYQGQCYQNSGIDWKDVKLTLSTGNPNLGGKAPTMSPWFLYVMEIEAYRTRTMSNAYKKAEAAPSVASGGSYDYAARDEEAEPGFGDANTLANFTEMVEGAVAVEFAISLPQDLPTGGKPRQVTVRSEELPTEFRHIAIPKLDPSAFLTARVTGWESLNLLPGKVNVFMDGTYLAESFLDPHMTEDTLEFSLGRDPKVVVLREQIKELTKNRIIGINKERTYAYDITVKNTKSRPIELLLLDQVPKSNDVSIEVKVIETSGAVEDPDNGKLEWRMKLQPGDVKKVRLTFSVKHPKAKVVTGL